MDLSKRVLTYILRNNLLSAGDSVLVAVSGGPDSVCLLHLLNSIAHQLKIEVKVAHFNHHLRGKESDEDVGFVKELAEKLKLPVITGEGDVKAFARKNRCSLEEAGREMRYAFLSQTAKSADCSAVAVGHNADDHVETILIHIIRGSGTSGLQGISPVSIWRGVWSTESVKLVHPLLEITRSEIEQYCKATGIEPRLDHTNLSSSFLRNRVRIELLPLLKKYNPGIRGSLMRLADVVKDDLIFLEQVVEKQRQGVVFENDNSIRINRSEILKLPLSVQRQILRQVIKKLLGSLRDIELKHIEYLRERIELSTGRVLNLPFGLTAQMEYDYLILRRTEIEASPFPLLNEEYGLNVSGETNLPGWTVLVDVIDKKWSPANKEGKLVLQGKELYFTAYFDRDKLSGRLTVRSRRRGDRFQPLGMKQEKRLQDFMVDEKIPARWRSNIPLLFSGERLIWVVGWRISEPVKVTPDTKRVVCISFIPEFIKLNKKTIQ